MRDAKEKAKELFDLHFSIQDQIEWTENEEINEEASVFQNEYSEETSFYWKELAKRSAIITANSIKNYYLRRSILKGSDEVYWDMVVSEILLL